MKYAVILLALFLAGCAGGAGPTPNPGPPPVPTPVTTPRPGILAGSANWTGPTLGAALYCNDDGPGNQFTCHLPTAALWGVLDAPGCGGMGGVDVPSPATFPLNPVSPLPNPCFQLVNGQLGYSVTPGGMALINAQTLPLDQPSSIEGVFTINLDCTQGVSYAGLVNYWGEGPPTDLLGNYYALYLSCVDGLADSAIQAWVYQGQMNTAAPVSAVTYANGSTHALRIDHIPGVSVTYLVDDVVVHVDTIATITAAALTFGGPSHPAIWAGALLGWSYVGRFDWYVGPPTVYSTSP